MSADLATYELLARARLWLRGKLPWFTPAVLGLRPVVTTDVETMAVSEQLVLYVNPTFAASLTVEQCAAVLAHEAMHPIRRHAQRFAASGLADTREMRQFWNVAADAEINDDLRAAGLRLPDGAIFPQALGCAEGLTAEEYATAMLSKPQSQRPKPGKGPAQGSCGSGAGNPSKGEPEKGSSSPAKGSPSPGATSDPSEGEGDPGAPSTGDGEDSLGATPAEVDAVRAALASALIEAKSRGTVPSGLARWAAATLAAPKVRWQDRLRRVIGRAMDTRPGARDYAHDRPSRRQAGVGYGAGRPVLARTIDRTPRVAICVDTSGSMAKADLARALSEVRGILRAGCASVELSGCDAAMNDAPVVVTDATLTARASKVLKGGGGTSFIPGVRAFAERRREQRPDLLVYVTDGMGDAPRSRPVGMQLVWVLVGDYTDTHLRASGAVVRVER